MKKASSAEILPGRRARTKGRGMWLLVFAGFALLTAAYVVAFRVAFQARIREVPVDRQGVVP